MWIFPFKREICEGKCLYAIKAQNNENDDVVVYLIVLLTRMEENRYLYLRSRILYYVCFD